VYLGGIVDFPFPDVIIFKARGMPVGYLSVIVVIIVMIVSSFVAKNKDFPTPLQILHIDSENNLRSIKPFLDFRAVE